MSQPFFIILDEPCVIILDEPGLIFLDEACLNNLDEPCLIEVKINKSQHQFCCKADKLLARSIHARTRAEIGQKTRLCAARKLSISYLWDSASSSHLSHLMQFVSFAGVHRCSSSWTVLGGGKKSRESPRCRLSLNSLLLPRLVRCRRRPLLK